MRNLWARFGLLALALGLVLLNLLLQQFFVRWDLTQDRRFSITDVTRATLDSLQAPVTATLYMEGNFPPTLQRLQIATLTLLEEYAARSRANFTVVRQNPADDPEARAAFDSLGLYPGETVVTKSEVEEQRIVYYPFVRLSYQGRSQYIDLLKGSNNAQSDIEALAAAEAQLEYKLTSGLRRLALTRPVTVGLYAVPGALTPNQMPELLAELVRLYQPAAIDLRRGPVLVPPGYPEAIPGAIVLDALVLPQPTRPFSEREKYTLDQYLMRGGSLLWLLDQVAVSEADLNETGSTLAQARQLNLDDFFFKSGLKLSYTSALDVKCGYIDALARVQGRDRIQPQRWVYFPLVQQFEPHPVTRGLDAVLLRFASTLDTLPSPGIEKTVLFRTSPYSVAKRAPFVIDFNETLRYRPDPTELRGGGQLPLAVALSGTFSSLFVGRQPPTDSLAPTPPAGDFRATSAGRGRQVVIADGAVVQGNHSRVGGPGLVLDNKLLVLNALDYLVGDEALTQIRNREVRFRTLDRTKVLGSETTLRVVNLTVPLVLVVVAGVVIAWRRRRRYGTRR